MSLLYTCYIIVSKVKSELRGWTVAHSMKVFTWGRWFVEPLQIRLYPEWSHCWHRVYPPCSWWHQRELWTLICRRATVHIELPHTVHSCSMMPLSVCLSVCLSLSACMRRDCMCLIASLRRPICSYIALWLILYSVGVRITAYYCCSWCGWC